MNFDKLFNINNLIGELVHIYTYFHVEGKIWASVCVCVCSVSYGDKLHYLQITEILSAL